mgnify:CR=1 FL=1
MKIKKLIILILTNLIILAATCCPVFATEVLIQER